MRPPSEDIITAAMSGSALLQAVDETLIRAWVSRGTTRQYRKGSYVFHQGDDPERVFFMLSGSVEISSMTRDGQRQLHTILRGTQFLGELGVLGNIPRTATALATHDSWLWSIDADGFTQFVVGNPPASRALLYALARLFEAHEQLIEELLFLDLRGRVAKRLLALAAVAQRDPGLATTDEAAMRGRRTSEPIQTIDITQTDLASMCGATRENVTRILSEFQRKGITRRNGRRYVISDVGRLERLAGL